MKHLLQKWLGIAKLENEIINLREQCSQTTYLLANNKDVTLKHLQENIDKAILKQDELNAFVSKNLAEIDGIKEILEYHTKELVELKKANKPKATPAKKA